MPGKVEEFGILSDFWELTFYGPGGPSFWYVIEFNVLFFFEFCQLSVAIKKTKRQQVNSYQTRALSKWVGRLSNFKRTFFL